ncbi:uncharacterized protein LOC110677222 [Aedes aegypti]|uniref:Uncharacterized protein n=3 Tax=Aedes aegypti TaxID=7159 RepID=A0A903VKH3_AEDAE|nr:uncharacterized protein LOC110677222 [Aedes aegypti]
MASVASLNPISATGRQTPARKISSPYRPTPIKSRYTKSPNKVSRNNTFIATSRRMVENGGDGLCLSIDDDHFQGKIKCSSAGAVEGLKQDHVQEGSNIVEIFKGDTIKFSGSEEDRQLPAKEIDSSTAVEQPAIVEDSPKKPSAIPVKTEAFIGRPIRSQRSIISGSDSKTIKFLLKLTTKSYFETLKYEIDRIKENDRKIQDQASSNAQSIMALISKGVDFDRKMEDLRAQNVKLLLETREKDRVQLDTVNAITSELNELKSVCNLLLKNIEKDRELDLLARKLHKSKRFDSNTYKMLRSQLRKPLERNVSKRTLPKLVSKQSITSLPSRSRSEMAIKRQKSKASRWSSVKQKSDWSSVSSMSSVETGSDMLTDIEIASDPKTRSSRTSQKKLNSPAREVISDSVQDSSAKRQARTKKRKGFLKIFCCGSGSRVSKHVADLKDS